MIENFRFERKFLLEDISLTAALAMINQHPAGFRKLYPERQVNNIYFDTPSMQQYKANLSGVSSRKKFRVRWYGDSTEDIEKPVLEIKTKEGQVGAKQSFSLPPFHLQSPFILHPDVDLPPEVLLDVSCQEPVLANTYLRKYFNSADGAFRLTLDRALTFFPIHHKRVKLQSPYRMPSTLVIELKYDTKEDDRAHRLTSAFPFRMTKSSKYAMGIERILSLSY